MFVRFLWYVLGLVFWALLKQVKKRVMKKLSARPDRVSRFVHAALNLV